MMIKQIEKQIQKIKKELPEVGALSSGTRRASPWKPEQTIQYMREGWM